MKFKNYLKESRIDMGDMENLVKDCTPFLRDWEKNDFLDLFSGRQLNVNIGKKSVRKNRTPKDTPEFIHNALDDEFKNKFGVKARSNSIFATFSVENAYDYGNAYHIFPVGRKYAFIYSQEIDDLYTWIDMHIQMEIEKIFLKRILGGIKSFSTFFYKRKKDVIYYDTLWQEFTTKKPEDNTERYKKLTKDHFESIVKKVAKEAVSKYQMSKFINDISILDDQEIMIICDEVWLLKDNYTYIRKLKEMMESIL